MARQILITSISSRSTSHTTSVPILGSQLLDAVRAIQPVLFGDLGHRARAFAALEHRTVEHIALAMQVSTGVAAHLTFNDDGGIAGNHPALVPGVRRQRLERGANRE